VSTLADLHALRARPWWVPTLLLLLGVAVMALRITACIALIVVDAVERCDALARSAGVLLLDGAGEAR
jgi:hypothetical protein